MSEFHKDLAYYRNLFPDNEHSITDQSIIIKWSKRKCYVYKFFITNLSELEVEIIKKATCEPDFELIGAISIHDKELRVKILHELERIQLADSSFEEIQIITNENLAPNPLHSMPKDYWLGVKTYLEEREYDEYPFSKKSQRFLGSVARIGYENLSSAQLKFINGLIANDRDRPETDHFFVNDYLIENGFKIECKAIEKVWANH